jgi:CubicO group peptidase (beta-lactamase class C family)
LANVLRRPTSHSEFPGLKEVTVGIGFALPHPEAVRDLPDEQICYWGGWGGSMAVMNPDRRTTFAYLMNKMGQVTSAGTERTRKYTRLICQALG